MSQSMMSGTDSSGECWCGGVCHCGACGALL